MLCKQNLVKERKQPPVVTPKQADFYNIFILCLWLRIIRTPDQGVYLVHEFSFTDILYDMNHGYRAAMLKKIL